jgi:hypothetical protein
MFELEKAIEQWRRQMSARGLKTSEVLKELEGHLREDVEQQVRAGENVQRAFEAAVRRLGQADALRTEFKKTAGTPAARMMALACALLVGFILWMSGYTFVKLELSAGEQVLAYAAVGFSLIVACGWRYAVPLLPVIPNRRARMAVGLGCIASGFVCSNLFCQFVLPPFERGLDSQLPAIGFWAVVPIAVFSCTGVGLMMSVRDRKFRGMDAAEKEPPATAGP